MSDYKRDAYVQKLPEGWPEPWTHSIVVDIMDDDGSVRHQIIAEQFGENNALMTAEQINKWRDHTRYKQ